MKKRPIGVTAFGVLAIVAGCQAMVATVVVITILSRATSMPLSSLLSDVYSGPSVLALVSLGGVGPLWLASGIGVLRLQNWGRLLLLFSVGISALLQAGFIIFFAFAIDLGKVVGRIGGTAVLVFCWYALILWYFLRPAVKAQFISKGS